MKGTNAEMRKEEVTLKRQGQGAGECDYRRFLCSSSRLLYPITAGQKRQEETNEYTQTVKLKTNSNTCNVKLN